MAFRFPSLATIGAGVRRAVQRFPVALGFSVLAAVLGHVAISVRWEKEEQLGRGLLIAGSLAVLAFAVRLRFETRRIHPRVEWAVAPGLLLVGTGIFFFAPPFKTPHGVVFLALWTLLVLAILSLAPFSRRKEFRGFWRHGHACIDRVTIAALFTGAAWLGLALALIAIRGLFGVNIDSEVFSHLAVTLFLFVAPLLAVAGYPEAPEKLDSDVPFPSALRAFAQWVMVPLVSVYGVILLAYALQILFTWQWPKGTVGWLVSWAGVLGIASNLVLLPLVEKHEYRWLRIFLRAFYGTLTIFAVLLLLAAYRRVAEYGWTEERVLLAVLGFWFLGIAAYFSVRPGATRQWVPASLGALALVLAVGPLSAHSIAVRDQTKRLDATLRRLGLAEDTRPRSTLSAVDRRTLWEQLDFFYDREMLWRISGTRFPKLQPKGDRLQVADVFAAIGQPETFPYAVDEATRWQIETEGDVLPVGGYEHFFVGGTYGGNFDSGRRQEIRFGARRLFLASDQKTLRLEESDGRALVTFDLVGWRTSLDKKTFMPDESRVSLPLEKVAIDGQGLSGWKARVWIRNASVEKDTPGVDIRTLWLAFREPSK